MEDITEWYGSSGNLYSVCPKCSGSISDEKRKCVDCGAAPQAPCRLCSEWIPANSVECPQCGGIKGDATTTEDVVNWTKIIFGGGFLVLGLICIVVGIAISTPFAIVFYLIGGLSILGSIPILILAGLLGKLSNRGKSDSDPNFVADMGSASRKVLLYNSKKDFKKDLENLDEDDIDQLMSAGKAAKDVGQAAREGYQEAQKEIKNIKEAKNDAKDAIDRAETILESEDYVDDGLQTEIKLEIDNVEEKINNSDTTAEEIRSATDTLLNKLEDKRVEINKKSYENKIESKGKTIWSASCPSTDCIEWGMIKYSRGTLRGKETENVGFSIIDRTEMPLSSDKLTLQCEECNRRMTISADNLEE